MGRLIARIWDRAFGPLIWSDYRPEQAEHIPQLCSCTWLLRLGAVGATWALTQPDPTCKEHGGTDETRGRM